MLAVRDEHPAWGGRKIRRRLQDLEHQPVPSASTITAILHRHGRIDAGGERRPQSRLSGLSGRRRTSCGRWTTRAILRRARGAATR